MNDALTNDRLVVSTQSPEYPYLMILYTDLPKVEAALRAHDIRFWPDEETISVNDEPEIIFVNFPRGTDAGRIQTALDSLD